MKNFTKRKWVIALAVTFLIGLPLGVFAAANTMSQSIYVGPDEIIEGNFIKAGNVIDINGPVNGDVIVAGSSITISGPVAGDVIAAGNTIRIKGSVGGSVRVVGASVEISNEVAKNVWAVASTVNLGPEAKVGWDVYAAAGNIEIKGPVAGNVWAAGVGIVIGNQVGKNVLASIDKEGQLILYPEAKISGSLTYKAKSEEQLVIKEGAVVSGAIEKKALPLPTETDWKKAFIGASIFFKIISLFSLLVIGLVLVVLLPKVALEIKEEMVKRPMPAIGWGFIYLIATPVIILLLILTVIGLPLALILIPVYLIALYASEVLVGFTLGLILFDKLSKKEKKYKGSLIWPLAVGLLIFVVITSLPLIGWLVKLFLVLWALGAALQVKKQLLKDYR